MLGASTASAAARLTVSSARIDLTNRALTIFSSSSPTPWPMVSLMRLKLSRSTNITATFWRWRCA